MLPNATSISVNTKIYAAAKARSASQEAQHISPADESSGSCGTSYTTINEWSLDPFDYLLEYGFTTYSASVYYSWDTSVQYGPNSSIYQVNFPDSGNLDFQNTWGNFQIQTPPVPGYYLASNEYGAAVLWYGGVCEAGPTDSQAYIL